MRHLKVVVIVFLILAVFSIQVSGMGGERAARTGETVTFAMCRPLVSQIENIEQMYEKDIITLENIHLILVYHEDESTDYEPAKAYVKENKLDWVTFAPIKGKVAPGDLFKENEWTEQFRSIFDQTAGIIFTGGMDIPASIYGEETRLLTEIKTPNRHYYEISFLFHLIGGSRNTGFAPFLETRKDYPVLGICLGAQSMNVAAGGTLYQDIPTQVYGLETFERVLKQDREKIHSSRYVKGLFPLETDLPPAFHRVKFVKGGICTGGMKMKTGDEPFVLTSHHQALKTLGKDLKVSATSMDGKIIEAVEHRKYPNVVGIQFHPEYFPLYLKGRFFREAPGQPRDFNLRRFLMDHPPSMQFHKAIWHWFSEALKAGAGGIDK